MSKSRAMGRHASSSSALRATRSTRLCTRIHFLRIPRRRSSMRQRQAARRVIPEQVVGDEDLVADALRSPGRPTRSIARAPTARAAARSSRTSSGTGSRAPFRAATSDDGRGRRIGCASRPPVAAPAAERSRDRTVPENRRSRTTTIVLEHRHAGHALERPAGLSARRRSPAQRARHRRGRRHRRRPARNGSGYAAAVWPPRIIGTPGTSCRTRRARASTSSVSSACMPAMPTSPGRVVVRWCSSERLKRRSAIVLW